MTQVGIAVAFGATTVLLIAGYLFGARRGQKARLALVARAEEQDQENSRLKAQLEDKSNTRGSDNQALLRNIESLVRPLMQQDDGLSDLRGDLKRLTISLDQSTQAQGETRRDEEQRQVRELRRAMEPLLDREQRVQHLQARLETLITPLMAREKLGQDLANLALTSKTSRGLGELLQNVADRGHFSAVLLSDEAGLPLAASDDTPNAEAMAGVSSLLLILADRIPRHGLSAPDAFILRDSSGKLTMHRIFASNDKRYLLSVISEDRQISPDLFDGVIGKLAGLLAKGPASR